MFYEEYSKNIKHMVVIYRMIKVLYKSSCNSSKWSNFIFLLFSPLGTHCKWKGTPCDILLNRVWISLFEINELSLHKFGVMDSSRYLTLLISLIPRGKIYFNFLLNASLSLAGKYFGGGIMQHKHWLNLYLNSFLHHAIIPENSGWTIVIYFHSMNISLMLINRNLYDEIRLDSQHLYSLSSFAISPQISTN